MIQGIITKSDSGNFLVLADSKIYFCRGRGVFRKDNIKLLVGDYVKFNEKEGYIMELLPRKNFLIRPPIANVDQAIVVMSAKEPELSLNLLDKILVTVTFKNIDVVVIINKIDLLNEKERKNLESLANYYENIGYKTTLVSTKTKENINLLNNLFKDKITVLAGQSGVGKSSILNALDKNFKLKTSPISKTLGRGRHTTRHVELINIQGGLVADTPGFSKLDFNELELEDLRNSFPEFFDNASECKYRSCNHIEEDGCNIKKLLEEGRILSSRYENYLKFAEEIKHRKPRY